MEIWFIILTSLCISALIKRIFNLILSPSNSSSNHKKLPPGPTTFPVIGNFLLLLKSYSELESLLRSSWAKYGPIITLRIGPRQAVFVGSHSVAHKALIQNGAVFSDRPKSLTFSKLDKSSQHKISTAPYGPRWRLLRRNLTSGVLHPSCLESYSTARQWVLEVLINRLVKESQSGDQAVRVLDHFKYAMFCLLALMCFGDRLDETQIKEVDRVQRKSILIKSRVLFLNFWPMLISKIVFRNRWKEIKQLTQDKEEVFIPLIRSRTEFVERRRAKKEEGQEQEQESVMAYVDSLLDLELPEEKRKLNDEEIVNLCSEFLNAGTDSSLTSLQWIMANLVKYPHFQTKLFEEINGVMGPPPLLGEKKQKGDMVMIKDEDLHRMPYLKCVVLEGLRRHPPGHVVLPHSPTKDVELEGYMVPKGTTVNFMVADIGWDPEVWYEPMEFKPERFFTKTIKGGEVECSFDITGTREIKMMPFGAGRRICPALGLALLHLEFLVANLVWYFEWTPAEGDTVDLSEKKEFTVVMKYPLRAHICPRGLPQNR